MASGMETSPRIDALGQTGMTQLEIALERKIVAAPFERYYYNNAAYRLTFTALERASKMPFEELTATEIFEPLSFSDAHWMRIYAVDETSEHPTERLTGYQSIRMTPRDFAKSAQVIVGDGLWNGERFLPAQYVQALVRPQEPPLPPEANPSFGLFHHLNAGSFYRDIAVPNRIERKLVPGAPDDCFLMFGSGGQVVCGIPSQQLVVVRTGPNAGSIYDDGNYIAPVGHNYSVRKLSSPSIDVVQSFEHGFRNDVSARGQRRNRSRPGWWLEGQRAMRPRFVVVGDVGTKYTAQMPLVQHDDVVSALASDRADHALREGIRFRRPDRCQDGPYSDPRSPLDEVPPVAPVTVADEETSGRSPTGSPE